MEEFETDSDPVEEFETDFQVPVEIREHTPFFTDSGTVNVIHEITLGDFLISTLIMALLVFQIMSRFVRR